MRIFVCYRREDSAPWAGRVHDALSARFGAPNIFQDVEAVRPGESFVDAIDAAVTQADAMVVIIGPRWLVADEGGTSRLASADDYVRRELEVALGQGTRVVPILVGGATMPTVAQVPEVLRPIVTRQAVVLHDESWRSDLGDLTGALGGDGTAPAASRRRRLPLAAAGAALLLTAGGVTWALTSRHPEGNAEAGNGSLVATSGQSTGACSSPRGSGWHDLGFTTAPAAESGQGWRLAVASAAAQPQGSGRTLTVFRLTAKNLSPSIQFLYNTGWSVVGDGGFRQSCFSLLRGKASAGPGETIVALVGFIGAGDGTGITSIDADQTGGEHYRIDLERSP